MLNSIRIGNLWKENFHSFTLCCPHCNLHIMRCNGNFRKWFSKFSKPQTPDTAVTENMTFPRTVDSLTLKVGESKLIELSSEKQNPLPNGQARTVKLLPLMTAEGLTLSKRVRLWFLQFQKTNQSRNFRLRWQNQPRKTAKLLNLYNGKSWQAWKQQA